MNSPATASPRPGANRGAKIVESDEPSPSRPAARARVHGRWAADVRSTSRRACNHMPQSACHPPRRRLTTQTARLGQRYDPRLEIRPTTSISRTVSGQLRARRAHELPSPSPVVRAPCAPAQLQPRKTIHDHEKKHCYTRPPILHRRHSRRPHLLCSGLRRRRSVV